MQELPVQELTSVIEAVLAKSNADLNQRLDKIDQRIGDVEEALRRLTRVAGVMDPTGTDEATAPGEV